MGAGSGSCSDSGSGSCSAVSMVSSASTNGMRVEPDGDIPDLGPVEADSGDIIRSILSRVGFKLAGAL